MKSNVKVDLVGLVFTWRSIWTQRGKIKIKILVSQEGVQNINNAGMPKRVKGGLSEGAVEGQKQGGGGGLGFGLGRVFWKPPPSLFSARSWHGSSWQDGDGISRLKLADDW